MRYTPSAWTSSVHTHLNQLADHPVPIAVHGPVHRRPPIVVAAVQAHTVPTLPQHVDDVRLVADDGVDERGASYSVFSWSMSFNISFEYV